jgi:hypothetical protein
MQLAQAVSLPGSRSASSDENTFERDEVVGLPETSAGSRDGRLRNPDQTAA